MLSSQGWEVVGLDNDMRQKFFGPAGSTASVIEELKRIIPRYRHIAADVRDRRLTYQLLRNERPNFIIHTAAQPSHDKATSIPYDDFDINAVGTLNLLVAARDFCPESPFCFTSTNKVYGDRPNSLELVEGEMRYEYANGIEGIDEGMSIDACLHSLFGALKAAADVLAQEFGHYFNMPVGIFRCGCMTGPHHAAVESHGYLAYIVFCAVTGKEYTVHGYKGKQVRDQIHCDDVASLFLNFYHNPSNGEVYNLGGGKANSVSILETISILDRMGYSLRYRLRDEHRIGDHICYITDLGKIRSHYPKWRIRHDIHAIIDEIVDRFERERTEPAELLAP